LYFTKAVEFITARCAALLLLLVLFHCAIEVSTDCTHLGAAVAAFEIRNHLIVLICRNNPTGDFYVFQIQVLQVAGALAGCLGNSQSHTAETNWLVGWGLTQLSLEKIEVTSGWNTVIWAELS
jgi:hypothetical protein